MDPQNPLRSLAPGVDADVLLALHGTHAPLTGSRVAHVAGRSETQVREVLRRLVEQGLVHSEPVGRSTIYTLNREHVLAAVVDAALRSPADIEARIVEAFESWSEPPMAAAVFGSFARRDGDDRSDVDLLLVRPREVSEAAEPWSTQRYELARAIEAWTGNRAQILEVSVAELEAAIDADAPLVASLRQDARWFWGDGSVAPRWIEVEAKALGVAEADDAEAEDRLVLAATAGICRDYPDWPAWLEAVRGSGADERLAELGL